jgi:excisionase family DNA binding protein
MERIAVSIKEACRSIGIGRTKTYELIKEGRLDTFKLGRRTLVTVASIHSLITESQS